jgi:hypothetical protein
MNPPSALSVTSGGITFQLINPIVTTSGKVYYWLDISRDGTFNGDSLNSNILDQIFNSGADTSANVSTRSFSQGAYTFLLPSYSEFIDLLRELNDTRPTNWGDGIALADLQYAGRHLDAVFSLDTMLRNGMNSSANDTEVKQAIVEVQSTSFSTASSTPICFTRGTHIQIGGQSKPVETLTISNQVSTKTACAAIKWIGYQRRTPEFAQFQDYLPVKISAGALDDNLPLRDLYLSPDHAVLVDGHLVHAKALVNGKTIVQMTQWAGDIEYYHIETEAHEIIYAEGVPCETFIDNVSREQFDNYAEYQALYPNTRMMKELPLPRVKFKRQLPTMIKQRLESRITELDRQHKV